MVEQRGRAFLHTPKVLPRRPKFNINRVFGLYTEEELLIFHRGKMESFFDQQAWYGEDVSFFADSASWIPFGEEGQFGLSGEMMEGAPGPRLLQESHGLEVETTTPMAHPNLQGPTGQGLTLPNPFTVTPVFGFGDDHEDLSYFFMGHEMLGHGAAIIANPIPTTSLDGGLGRASVPPPITPLATPARMENVPPPKPQLKSTTRTTTRTVKRKSSEIDALADDGDPGLRASGPFTPKETTLLETAVEEYRMHNGLTDYQIRETIQDSNRKHNHDTAPLWQHICLALPHRQKPAIQKVARRKFHNFAKRGKWTTAEEAELLHAYNKTPQRWKQIGEAIGRFPEDCRDRYRNYLKCGKNQKKDVWDAAETRKFKEVVNTLLEDLRKDLSSSSKKRKLSGSGTVHGDKDSLESLIDWDVVSEKLGRSRSRLQCRNKWEKLKEAQMRDLAIDRAYLEADQDARKAASPRYLQAKANYEHMKPGDKYLIISLIRNSLEAEQRKYEHEIPWQMMQKASEDDCMWTLPERKVCLKEMKKLVQTPRKGGFLAYLGAILSYLKTNYPGQMQDFYDGPLEYTFTTVPKRTNDPRRRAIGKHGKSRTSSNASASAPQSIQSSTSTSTADSVSTPVTEDEIEDMDLDQEGSPDEGFDGDSDDDSDAETKVADEY